MSLCCDYRVMSNSPVRIGLNETNLGIAAPYWLIDLYIDTIGRRNAELALLEGSLFSPEDAERLNLVDQIVDQDEVYPTSLEMATKFGAIPRKGRVATKLMVRGPAVQKLLDQQEEDVKWFCDFLLEEGTQKGIKAYLDGLRTKKK